MRMLKAIECSIVILLGFALVIACVFPTAVK
jgi:hypothetical protein